MFQRHLARAAFLATLATSACTVSIVPGPGAVKASAPGATPKPAATHDSLVVDPPRPLASPAGSVVIPYVVSLAYADGALPAATTLDHFQVTVKGAGDTTLQFRIKADRGRFPGQLFALPRGPLAITWTAADAGNKPLGETSFQAAAQDGVAWGIQACVSATGVTLAAAQAATGPVAESPLPGAQPSPSPTPGFTGTWPFPLPSYDPAPASPRPNGLDCQDEVCGPMDVANKAGALYDPDGFYAAYRAQCALDWTALDADHDGRVSFDEWSQGRFKYRVLSTPALSPDTIFKGLDDNGDGFLTADELCSDDNKRTVPFPAARQPEHEPNDGAGHAEKLAPGVTFVGSQRPDDVDDVVMDLPPGTAGHVVVRFIKAADGAFNMRVALANAPDRTTLSGDATMAFDLDGSWTPVLEVKTEVYGVIDNPDNQAEPYWLAYYVLPPGQTP